MIKQTPLPRSNDQPAGIHSLPDHLIAGFVLPFLPESSKMALYSSSRRFRFVSPSVEEFSIRRDSGNLNIPRATFRVGVFEAAGYDSSPLFATLNGGSTSGPSTTPFSASVCFFPESGVQVQLSFEQIPYHISSPKEIKRYRNLHAAVVMYNPADVYSLLESAKCILGEIDKFATPVPVSQHSFHSMSTQVILVGTKHSAPSQNHSHLMDGASMPEKFPATVERASTLVPLCKRVEFVDCIEIDQTDQKNVENMSRLLAQVCYKAYQESTPHGVEPLEFHPKTKRPRCIIM